MEAKSLSCHPNDESMNTDRNLTIKMQPNSMHARAIAVMNLPTAKLSSHPALLGLDGRLGRWGRRSRRSHCCQLLIIHTLHAVATMIICKRTSTCCGVKSVSPHATGWLSAA